MQQTDQVVGVDDGTLEKLTPATPPKDFSTLHVHDFIIRIYTYVHVYMIVADILGDF